MHNSTKLMLMSGAVLLAVAQPALAEGPKVYDGYQVPHDSLGHPDLSGVWDAATITTFQRLPTYHQLVMTPDEVKKAEGTVAAINAQAAKKTDQTLSVKDLPKDGSGNYNAGFLDPGTTVMRVHGEPRTSLVTTADGLIPPYLDGRPRIPARFIGGEEGATSLTVQDMSDKKKNENPETRSLSERCVLGFSNGVVIAPTLYDSITTIQQSKDSVAIESEMIHAVRVVHLNGKHRTDGIREWDGDSIGHYEGNTLVVETIGYDPRFPAYGASPDVKVTERFTRVSPTRLHYAFTIDDPKTWAKPWGGEYELKQAQGTYEYACTEGNYGQEATLAGARFEEQQEREKVAALAAGK